MKRVVAHIQKKDVYMARALARYFKETSPHTPRSKDPFLSLARSIVGQQLSTKAADAIWRKFCALFRDGLPSPTKVARTSDERLRSAGLSSGKVRALRALTDRVRTHKKFFGSIETASTEVIYEELTAIHGIGPWTVEMFLMFTLERPDIFSPGDLGLRKGIQILDKRDTLPTPQEAMERAARWAPYRTYASRALWHLLDT